MRVRLVGITDDNNSQFILGEESVLVLAKTSDDESVAISGWGRLGSSISMSHLMSQSSPESISTKIPTGTAVASSHPWSDSHRDFGSRALVGAVVTGSIVAAGRSSPSVGGSGIIVSLARDVDGLCSGSGCVTSVWCGWTRLLSSSTSPTSPTVNMNPFVHSAKLM